MESAWHSGRLSGARRAFSRGPQAPHAAAPVSRADEHLHRLQTGPTWRGNRASHGRSLWPFGRPRSAPLHWRRRTRQPCRRRATALPRTRSSARRSRGRLPWRPGSRQPFDPRTSARPRTRSRGIGHRNDRFTRPAVTRRAIASARIRSTRSEALVSVDLVALHQDGTSPVARLHRGPPQAQRGAHGSRAPVLCTKQRGARCRS
jgi:hypothetical protein